MAVAERSAKNIVSVLDWYRAVCAVGKHIRGDKYYC